MESVWRAACVRCLRRLIRAIPYWNGQTRDYSVKTNYPKLIVELRPSKMLPGEVGLFSVRHIPRYTVIADSSVFEEESFISWQAWRRIDKTTRKKLYEFCPGTETGIVAPPDLNSLRITWYINHSCEPNAAFTEQGNLVALKPIRPDSEITWDYSSWEQNPNYRLICKCGSPSCRNVIGPNNSI